MIAALATLAFLTTLWMLVVVGSAVLETSGGRILIALRGRSMSSAVATRPVRLRLARNRIERPVRASARLRAAA